MKKRRGFTLVELMIAMAIIAILAMAGIQAYTGYVKKSRDTARAEIAQNLNSAVMSYAASNNGNPPASTSAFEEFISSSSELFVGSAASPGGTKLIKDPVGGLSVCLDADGNADEPCSYNYTAYEDGTYAISYGVEHESSTEGNFYKTTNSVVKDIVTLQSEAYEQTPVPKYGVYLGSAPYIGQDATTGNGDEVNNDDGVDDTYIPPGETIAQPLVVVFRSIRVDVPAIEPGPLSCPSYIPPQCPPGQSPTFSGFDADGCPNPLHCS